MPSADDKECKADVLLFFEASIQPKVGWIDCELPRK